MSSRKSVKGHAAFVLFPAQCWVMILNPWGLGEEPGDQPAPAASLAAQLLWGESGAHHNLEELAEMGHRIIPLHLRGFPHVLTNSHEFDL